jgi:NAD(P)-dependent dehydrogenase (short-subunit alcohol dehydrogenase family)
VKKVVLITGAGSGIGRETAKFFVQQGYTVCATSRRLETVQDIIGCEPWQLDVTNEPSIQQAVQGILAKHGGIDVLVNNAGYGLNGPIEELGLDALRHQFETNVFGLVRLTQLVLPTMRKAGGGRIINVGSVGGTFTAPGSGAYHASKWALESLNDALRYEVQGFGIDVVLIQPTGVYTAFDKNMKPTKVADSSPYKFFVENHQKVSSAIFDPNSRAGIIAPQQVARTIWHATQAKKPHTRYKVGLSAVVYSSLRRLVSDRFWDRLMALQFPMQARR